MEYYFMKSKLNIILFSILTSSSAYSQIFYSNGATVTVNGTLFCNGGITLTNGSNFENQGLVQATKNSVLPNTGNFSLLTAGNNVTGNGDYRIEQDWINNGNFSAQNSNVYLYGNTEQLISTSSGIVTEFNNLTLQGTGVGVNRRKTIQGADVRISTTGNLDLQNRILNTTTNKITVLNTAIASVSNTTVAGLEGYVASQGIGTFIRNTNQNALYLFPTGSFIGTERYRPAKITPNSATAAAYSVRLDNTDATLDGFNRTQTDNKSCTSNPLFYHSINRTSGATNADIAVSYNIGSDNDWSGVAQWRTASTNWNDVSTTTAALSGTLTYRTRTSWAFANPGFPYILTNIRPEPPVINCQSICENSDANAYTLTGTSATYQWVTSANGSIASGQGSDGITVDWLTGNGLITAVAVGVNACNSIPDSCVVIAVPQPIANFDFLVEGADVTFTNTSTNDAAWAWNFGDGSSDSQENTQHSYEQGGEVTVILLAENSLGCSDTASKTFTIDQKIEIPNVITPNGDDLNDIFLVKTGGLKSYNLKIVNRWGQEIFSSNDKNIHWNGKDNGGVVVEGVYFYKLKIETSSKTYDFHGNVTVID
jgi:gliding motility-associated-like protein